MNQLKIRILFLCILIESIIGIHIYAMFLLNRCKWVETGDHSYMMYFYEDKCLEAFFEKKFLDGCNREVPLTAHRTTIQLCTFLAHYVANIVISILMCLALHLKSRKIMSFLQTGWIATVFYHVGLSLLDMCLYIHDTYEIQNVSDFFYEKNSIEYMFINATENTNFRPPQIYLSVLFGFHAFFVSVAFAILSCLKSDYLRNIRYVNKFTNFVFTFTSNDIEESYFNRMREALRNRIEMLDFTDRSIRPCINECQDSIEMMVFSRNKDETLAVDEETSTKDEETSTWDEETTTREENSTEEDDTKSIETAF